MGLLYTQELADRAQAWISRPLTAGLEGKRSADGLLELASIWAAIHRQPLPECIRQCQYSERQASVAAYLREFSRLQNLTTMSDTPTASKYQLAPQFANETLVDENLSGSYTADTLTDEVAEHFIKRGRKDLFVERNAAGTPAAETTEAEPGDARDYEAELAAQEDAHASTRQELERQAVAHDATTAKLEKETAAHGKATEALKAEKEAHKVTKAENSELQKQVKDLQKQLDKVAKAAEVETPPAPADAQ